MGFLELSTQEDIPIIAAGAKGTLIVSYLRVRYEKRIEICKLLPAFKEETVVKGYQRRLYKPNQRIFYQRSAFSGEANADGERQGQLIEAYQNGELHAASKGNYHLKTGYCLCNLRTFPGMQQWQ